MVTLTSGIYVQAPTSVTDIAGMSYVITDSLGNPYSVTVSNGWGPDDNLSLALGTPALTATGPVDNYNAIKASVSYLVTNLTPGINTFTAKYVSRSDSNAVQAGFNTRTIMVTLLN